MVSNWFGMCAKRYTLIHEPSAVPRPCWMERCRKPERNTRVGWTPKVKLRFLVQSRTAKSKQASCSSGHVRISDSMDSESPSKSVRSPSEVDHRSVMVKLVSCHVCSVSSLRRSSLLSHLISCTPWILRTCLNLFPLPSVVFLFSFVVSLAFVVRLSPCPCLLQAPAKCPHHPATVTH